MWDSVQTSQRNQYPSGVYHALKHSQAGHGPLMEHFWLRGKRGDGEAEEKQR